MFRDEKRDKKIKRTKGEFLSGTIYWSFPQVADIVVWNFQQLRYNFDVTSIDFYYFKGYKLRFQQYVDLYDFK